MSIFKAPVIHYSSLREIVATRTSEHGAAYVYECGTSSNGATGSVGIPCFRVVHEHILGAIWDKPDSYHSQLSAALVAAANAVA